MLTDVDPAELAAVTARVDELDRAALRPRRGPSRSCSCATTTAGSRACCRPPPAGSTRRPSRSSGCTGPTEPPPGTPPEPVEVVARCTFTAAHAGSPGRVHGGVLALALDEVTGVAIRAAGASGMTVRARGVAVRGACPSDRPVDIVARYTRGEGRKAWATGEVVVDGDGRRPGRVALRDGATVTSRGRRRWQAFCDRMAALGPVIEAEAPTPEAAAGGRAPPRQPGGVLADLRHRPRRPDPAGVLPQQRPRLRVGRPERRPGGPPGRHLRRRRLPHQRHAWAAARSSSSSSSGAPAQSGGAGVATEVSASALGLGPGDDIDIVLGGPERPDGRGHLAPAARRRRLRARPRLLLRLAGRRAGHLRDRAARRRRRPGPVRTDDHVAAVLDAAATEIEHSIAFWSGYQARMLAGLGAERLHRPGWGGRRGAGDRLQPRRAWPWPTTRPWWSRSTRPARRCGTSSSTTGRGTRRSTPAAAPPAPTTAWRCPTPTAASGS